MVYICMILMTSDGEGGLSISERLHGNAISINPYRYCGEYFDSETGYVYLRARYYNANLGRFISADAAKDGYNWYIYCGNDPVNRIDPSGEFAVTALLLAIGIGALTGAAMDMGSQLIKNGFDFGNLDAMSIIASGVSGAFSGAIGFFTAGVCSASLFGAMAVGAATNSVSYVAYNLVAGNELTWQGLGTAAASGAISAGIGYGISKAKGMLESQCFIAGTLVLTSSGLVAIEAIKAGDMVYAENPETGEKGIKRVVQTFENETTELVHVHVNGEEIITTPGHPFYVPQKGWTQAIDLRAGDILILVNGEYVTVEKTEHELLESPVKVYNFEVEDYNTYYVSDSGVLVHNKCNREKLKAYLQLSDNDIVGKDAHHVFPQKFRNKFLKIGIESIDSEQYLSFVDHKNHLGFSYDYNTDWEYFLEKEALGTEEVFSFARIMADKYGFKINF